MQILDGIRIVEFADAIAGPYCTKLFADLGAEVIKIESASGDTFRSRASVPLDGSDDGALFKFLNAGKSSIVGNWSDEEILALVASADVVVESLGPAVMDHGELRKRCPDLVVVTMSPYGQTGPYRLRPATEFTVQAESGTMALRGRPDQPPLQAGGRVFEWLMGSYAAVAAMAALRRAQTGGGGELVDCSLLETCHVAASGFAPLYHHLAGCPPLTLPARQVEVPSIEPTLDGWVGFNTNTRLQFESFLLMIGRFDLLEEDESWALATTRYERIEEWNEIVRSWTTQRTTDEIVALASDLRIPVAQVNNGRTVLDHPQFLARGVWAEVRRRFVHVTLGRPTASTVSARCHRVGRLGSASTRSDRRIGRRSRARQAAPMHFHSRVCGSSTQPHGGRGRRRCTHLPHLAPR